MPVKLATAGTTTFQFNMTRSPFSPRAPHRAQPHGQRALVVGERGDLVEARARQRELGVEDLELDAAPALEALADRARLFHRLLDALAACLDATLGRRQHEGSLVDLLLDLLPDQIGR